MPDMSQFKFQNKVKINKQNHNRDQDFELVDITDIGGTNTTTD